MDKINKFFKDENNLLNIKSLLNLIFSLVILGIAYGFLESFNIDDIFCFRFGIVSLALIYTGISNKNDATYRAYKNVCNSDEVIKKFTKDITDKSDNLQDITIVEDILKRYNKRQIEILNNKFYSYDKRKITRKISLTKKIKRKDKYKSQLANLDKYGSTRKIKYKDITASDIISFSKLNFKSEKDILNDNVLKRRKKKNSLTTIITNIAMATTGFLAFATGTDWIKTCIFVSLCIIMMTINYFLEYIFASMDTIENYTLTLKMKYSLLNKVSQEYEEIINKPKPQIKNDLLTIKEPN